MLNLKTLMLCSLMIPVLCFGQADDLSWSFNDTGKKMPIPADCDGSFNEELGRFVLPTPEELYQAGNRYLFLKDDEQLNAAYCFLSAALQGHLNSQYVLAQFYSRGMILPQNNLAAYKWAFLAGLQGHRVAERLAVSLEQYLSAEDIERASNTAKELAVTLPTSSQKQLEHIESEIAQKKQELADIYNEVDEALHISQEQRDKEAQKQLDIADKQVNDENKETTQQLDEALEKLRASRQNQQDTRKKLKSKKIFSDKDRFAK